MIACEKYSDLIQDLLEDELDERQAVQTEAHFFACRECRAQYETLRCAKEVYTQYLFDAEPPTGSWANFEARLDSVNEKVESVKVAAAANWFRRQQRVFGFSLSPATVALAALLFVCGIGFVVSQIGSVEKNGDDYIAETETDNSPAPAQSNMTGETSAITSKAETVTAAATVDASKNKVFLAESKSSKAKSNSLSGKNSSAETVKINQKTAASNDRRKPAGEPRPSQVNGLSALRAQNLEMEITGQMEKVELLLRSFRNARLNETTEGFDVEYEKKQARKLLGKNAQLQRSAEDYGLLYAQELFSRVEAYLLEIANLETNASTGRVLDIKERVDNQNIIASLQAYNRDVTQ